MTTQPTSSALHQLLLMDELLTSLNEGSGTARNVTEPGSSVNLNDAQNVQLTAEGPTQQTGVTSSMSKNSKREHILRVADFLFGGQFMDSVLAVLEMPDAVRRIRATPSGRTAFLVKGVSSASARGTRSSGYYLCFFSSAGAPVYAKDGKCYCACRSFFERAKHDPKSFCKHLLAIALMPHLEWPCPVETVSDEDYATILLDKAFS